MTQPQKHVEDQSVETKVTNPKDALISSKISNNNLFWEPTQSQSTRHLQTKAM